MTNLAATQRDAREVFQIALDLVKAKGVNNSWIDKRLTMTYAPPKAADLPHSLDIIRHSEMDSVVLAVVWRDDGSAPVIVVRDPEALGTANAAARVHHASWLRGDHVAGYGARSSQSCRWSNSSMAITNIGGSQSQHHAGIQRGLRDTRTRTEEI